MDGKGAQWRIDPLRGVAHLGVKDALNLSMHLCLLHMLASLVCMSAYVHAAKVHEPLGEPQ